MRHCCPRLLLKDKRRLYGVVEHFPLTSAAESFLSQRTLLDAKRFTFLRDPVDQFMSYLTMHQSNKYQKVFAPPLETAVQALTEYVDCKKAREDCARFDDVAQLYNFTVNVQARELGWQGTDDVSSVLLRLQSLDFVGLYEELEDSWRMLADRVGFCHAQFAQLNSKAGERDPAIPEDVVAKIAELQWADRRLYDEAKRIFQEMRNRWWQSEAGRRHRQLQDSRDL